MKHFEGVGSLACLVLGFRGFRGFKGLIGFKGFIVFIKFMGFVGFVGFIGCKRCIGLRVEGCKCKGMGFGLQV